jgi:hypothetical protein
MAPRPAYKFPRTAELNTLPRCNYRVQCTGWERALSQTNGCDMGGPDDHEDTQAAGARRDDLFATWWERALAGVAITLTMALLADIIARG